MNNHINNHINNYMNHHVNHHMKTFSIAFTRLKRSGILSFVSKKKVVNIYMIYMDLLIVLQSLSFTND